MIVPGVGDYDEEDVLELAIDSIRSIYEVDIEGTNRRKDALIVEMQNQMFDMCLEEDFLDDLGAQFE